MRPEHSVRYAPEPRGDRGVARCTAPVEVVEPTGAETIVVLRIGGRESSAASSPTTRPKQGETASARVDMRAPACSTPATEALICERRHAFANYASLRPRRVRHRRRDRHRRRHRARPSRAKARKVAFLDIDERRRARRLAAAHGARSSSTATSPIPTRSGRRSTAAAARLGPSRVLVNNAANDQRHDIDEVTPEDWDRAQAVNLRAAVLRRQAVRARHEGRSAAARSSTSPPSPGESARPTWSPTSPPRPAVIGLTNAPRPRLRAGPHPRERHRARRDHDRAAAPALVHDPESQSTRSSRRQAINHDCARRGDRADARCFLASDDSRMITKQCLIVDARPHVTAADAKGGLIVGLNPYGLTYTLGPARRGHAARQPARRGPRRLHRHRHVARRADHRDPRPWLAAMDDAALKALRRPARRHGHDARGQRRPRRMRARGCSTPPAAIGAPVDPHGPDHRPLRRPRGLRPAHWSELVGDGPRAPRRLAPRAADVGVSLAIENHQDFAAEELVDLCEEAGPAVRHLLRHGQRVPGGRSAARLRPHGRAPRAPRPPQGLPRPVHPEGYRLVRCAIGDGAVPFAEIAADPRRRRPPPDRRAGTRRARGPPRPPLHARLVARLCAEGRRARSPRASPPRR